MPLKTLQNARRTYAQLLRGYRFKTDESLEGGRFRDLVYGFSVLLNYFKAENDAELLQRVEALEKLVSGMKGGTK